MSSQFVTIARDTLKEVNRSMKNCNSIYSLVGFPAASKSPRIREMKEMVDAAEFGCHPGAINLKKNMFFVVAIDNETDRVVSYLTFSVYPEFQTLHKMYSCTKIDHRRRSLPTLFGWFAHEFAMKVGNIRWVVSYNVEASMGIARRFGAITDEKSVNHLILNKPEYDDTLGEALIFSTRNGMGAFNVILDLEAPNVQRIHEAFRREIVDCLIPSQHSRQ